MNKRFFVLVALLFAFSFCASTLAHSGRTDEKGGHKDNSTGEYHYHHGYPAHQHPNGECPYDHDDKTGDSSERENIGSSRTRFSIMSFLDNVPLYLLFIWILSSFVAMLFKLFANKESHFLDMIVFWLPFVVAIWMIIKLITVFL